MTLLLIIRIVHVLSAIVLVGAIIFNYFFLRPTLTKIPPAYAVIVSQRVGTLFTIIGLTSLGILFASGLTRLALMGAVDDLFSLSFYFARYGRWVGVMLLSWLVVLADSLIMTFLLRPTLMRKLTVNSNPTLADAEKRRSTQLASSNLLDRLQLVNVVFGILAALAGASLMLGGII